MCSCDTRSRKGLESSDPGSGLARVHPHWELRIRLPVKVTTGGFAWYAIERDRYGPPKVVRSLPGSSAGGMIGGDACQCPRSGDRGSGSRHSR